MGHNGWMSTNEFLKKNIEDDIWPRSYCLIRYYISNIHINGDDRVFKKKGSKRYINREQWYKFVIETKRTSRKRFPNVTVEEILRKVFGKNLLALGVSRKESNSRWMS